MIDHSKASPDRSTGGLWQSILAGTLATFPMTVFMLATQRFLPKGQRYDLPPEIITKDLAKRAHIKPFLNKQEIVAATLISHFGYGAAMGALYFPLERKRRILAPVQGILFGLLVWAGSYLGLLPLLRMSAAGHREPGQRNLMMIAAHVVWGVTLGVTADYLPEKKN
ncbi:MAG TPA: DUF1440 domain-containing protein, partial [Ktedonobacteraceae bacterium]|nr:DUF1440 domain-containing protein [Ktedonobacteraceae bacterium]